MAGTSDRTLKRAEAKLAALEAASQGREREILLLSDRLADATADAAKREGILTRRYEEQIDLLTREVRELKTRLEDERERSRSGLRRAEKKTGDVEARLTTARELVLLRDGEVGRLTKELSAARKRAAEVDRIERALAGAHRRIDELTDQRDEARDSAADAEARVLRAERKLRRMQVRQMDARAEVAEREREVERMRTALAKAGVTIAGARRGTGPETNVDREARIPAALADG